MAVFGADVEQLEQLANTLLEHHDRLKESIARLDSDLRVIWWKGRDAEMFIDRWESTSRPQLERFAEALDEAQLRLRNQAEEQRSVSEA